MLINLYSNNMEGLKHISKMSLNFNKYQKDWLNLTRLFWLLALLILPKRVLVKRLKESN